MAPTLNGSAQSGHGPIDDLNIKLTRLRVTIKVLDLYAKEDPMVQRYVDELSTVLRDVHNMIYRQNYDNHHLMGSGPPASTPHGPFYHELDQHYITHVVDAGHPPVHYREHLVGHGRPSTTGYYLNYNDYPQY